MRAEGRAIEAEDALESEQAHVQADNAFAAARRRAVADQRKAAAERTLRENAEDEQRKVDREKEGEQREQREQREKVRQQRLGWVGLEDTLGFSWLGQKKRAKTSLSIVRCPFSDVRVTAVQSAHS